MPLKSKSPHEGEQLHDHHEFTTRDRILSILEGSSHKNPVSRKDLVRLSGVPDREMRAWIENLRRDGNPILSRSGYGGGYWLSDSKTEVEAFTREYLAHCFSGILTINKMRRGIGIDKNQLTMGDVIHE